MTRVLLVDDEEAIHRAVSVILRLIEGVEIEAAYNGREALAKAVAAPPELVVTDVVMPEMDGWALTAEMRKHPALAHVPILLLTARNEDEDKYRSFDTGADDYLAKPFDPVELQLRVKALLRRGALSGAKTSPERLVAGPLTLLPQRYMANLARRDVPLTASEFAILKYMVAHPDAVINVETLLSQALDYPAQVGNPQVIHTHMKNIRRKFREAGAELSFLTSSRRGYMLSTVG